MRLDGCLMIIFDYRIFYRNIPDEGKNKKIRHNFCDFMAD